MAFGSGDFNEREIAEFYQNVYADRIRLAAQGLSAMQDTIEQEPLIGENYFVDSYRRINPPTDFSVSPAIGGDIVERVSPGVANIEAETPRFSTANVPRHWEFTEQFDPRNNPLRTRRQLRPDGSYTMNVENAFNRLKDRLVIGDVTETTQGGFRGLRLDSRSLAPIAPDGEAAAGAEVNVQVILADFGINATTVDTGLTFTKIVQAVDLLDRQGAKGKRRYISMFPEQLYDLFRFSEEVKSFDFNTARALVSGELDTYMGLDFRITTEIDEEADIASGVVGTNAGRTVYVYEEDAAFFGSNGDVDIFFDTLFQAGHSLQAAHYLDANASRMHAENIVFVSCLSGWDGIP